MAEFPDHTPLPIEMKEGALIDYVIELYGVPMPWRTRIDVWEPGVRFVDRQIAGPIDGGTTSTASRRRRAAPASSTTWTILPRAAWLSSWLVNRDVQRIFAYRQTALASLLTEAQSHDVPPQLVVRRAVDRRGSRLAVWVDARQRQRGRGDDSGG